MTKNKEEVPSLELALAQLDREYGRGTVLRLGEVSSEPWPSVPTGSWALDRILGIGGFPLGRITELWGLEACGKSTLCLSAVAEAQRLGLKCLYMDLEFAIDSFYAHCLGVDIPELYLSQPDTAEQALNIILTMIRSDAIKVIVVDSVAALLPKAELDGEIGQSHMALQGRLMSQALRTFKGEVAKHGVALIFINQLRASMNMYGPSKTTTGGNALKYYASVRVELAREKDLSATKDGEIYGIRVRAKTVKNKMAAPLKKCSFDLYFGKGIDNFMYLAEIGTELGIFRKSGTWLYYNDEEKPIAQGLENLAKILASDLDLAEKVKLEINAT